jgi:uncharacterized protein with NRDE domain
MCIVTFVKHDSEFVLTFNRDERIERPSAEPIWHTYNSKLIFCPMDLESNGTWIGYNTKIIACLQNGADLKHERNLPYDLSRGIILKDLLVTNEINTIEEKVKCFKIEPFTLSIYNLKSAQLEIYRYNGVKLIKEFTNLAEPKVICSSTLYNSQAQIEIEQTLKAYDLTRDSLFQFHKDTMIGNKLNHFTNLVNTVSITQLSYKNGVLSSHYFDSIKNQNFITVL